MPDNWNWEKAWNLPLDEFIEVIDGAQASGYTVVWASDIIKKSFSHRNVVAVVPETDREILDGMERDFWGNITQNEKDDLLYSFKKLIQETKINQEMRQKIFDNFTITNYHAMHITGMAQDQNGNKY